MLKHVVHIVTTWYSSYVPAYLQSRACCCQYRRSGRPPHLQLVHYDGCCCCWWCAAGGDGGGGCLACSPCLIPPSPHSPVLTFHLPPTPTATLSKVLHTVTRYHSPTHKTTAHAHKNALIILWHVSSHVPFNKMQLSLWTELYTLSYRFTKNMIHKRLWNPLKFLLIRVMSVTHVNTYSQYRIRRC